MQQDNKGTKHPASLVLNGFITDRTLQSAGAGIRAGIELQRCYCENSASPASHYCIMYTQSLHAINGLLAVGRAGNLLCGCSSYIKKSYFLTDVKNIMGVALPVLSVIKICVRNNIL